MFFKERRNNMDMTSWTNSSKIWCQGRRRLGHLKFKGTSQSDVWLCNNLELGTPSPYIRWDRRRDLGNFWRSHSCHLIHGRIAVGQGDEMECKKVDSGVNGRSELNDAILNVIGHEGED